MNDFNGEKKKKFQIPIIYFNKLFCCQYNTVIQKTMSLRKSTADVLILDFVKEILNSFKLRHFNQIKLIFIIIQLNIISLFFNFFLFHFNLLFSLILFNIKLILN